MEITRRHVLIGGGAAVLVLGAGGLWRVSSWTQNLDDATQPWREAGAGAGKSSGDVRLDCLAFAILAPNPHNLQPWLIKLDGKSGITIFCDKDKRLPATDPFNRQTTIGFGAFLELLRMAAAEKGYLAKTTPFPEGEPYPVLDNRPIARVEFIKSNNPRLADSLFAFALGRRTTRINYDDKPVSDRTLNKLNQLKLFSDRVNFVSTNDKSKAEFLKKIALESWKIELNTTRTWGESIKWTRAGSAQIKANPDGISLRGVPMEMFRVAGVLAPSVMADKNSLAFQSSYDFYADLIKSAHAWGWIWTEDNKRKTQLDAGRAWVRIHLQATKLGLALHPLSQALQEFPEMAKPYKQIHQWAGLKSRQTIQGLLRFGYASEVPPAPRWPLKKRLL